MKKKKKFKSSAISGHTASVVATSTKIIFLSHRLGLWSSINGANANQLSAEAPPKTRAEGVGKAGLWSQNILLCKPWLLSELN